MAVRIFEIELDRQVVQAGDELLGWLTVDDKDIEEIEVVFLGEEILGANDITYRHILSIVDEKIRLDKRSLGERQEFRFKVPDNAPPSYSSQDIRCQYGITATVRRGFWRRTQIRKLDVTILPLLAEELTAKPEVLEVEHEDLRLLASLDQTVVIAGEPLSGSLLFEKKSEKARLPQKLSFRFASIEESTKPSYNHRRVLTLETHDIEVDPELELPFTGFFEFPTNHFAEPSGTWSSFKVHYGFRVTFYDHEGKDHRQSTEIRMVRDMAPWIEKGEPEA